MDLPVSAIREQIASAIDVLVHQARFADGKRRIVSITEVTGIESGRIQMQPVFEFRLDRARRTAGSGGVFSGCDTVPSFYEPLIAAGVRLELSIFARTDDGL